MKKSTYKPPMVYLDTAPQDGFMEFDIETIPWGKTQVFTEMDLRASLEGLDELLKKLGR